MSLVTGGWSTAGTRAAGPPLARDGALAALAAPGSLLHWFLFALEVGRREFPRLLEEGV